MSKTYNHLIPDVGEILRPLVVKVNNNLTSDDDLDIPRVTYREETYKELIKVLTADSKSRTKNTSRYPLVALIKRYDYNIEANSPRIGVSLDIVIVTQSDPALTSTQRKEQKYIPILRPIYCELMEQIVRCRHFHGPYDPYPSHNMYESYNFGRGSDSGNVAYQFPDYVDAIVITGLQLKVNRTIVPAFNYGPTLSYTAYINNVSQVTLSAAGNQLTITLTAATHTDLFGSSEPQYKVNIPNGEDYTIHNIAVGGSHVHTVETSGTYIGFVSCNDGQTVSTLYFLYVVLNGEITKYTSTVKFSLENFVLSGFGYPQYPIDTVFRTIATKQMIKSHDITTNGGDVLYTATFDQMEDDTTLTTRTHMVDVPSGYRDMGYMVTIDGALDTTYLLESISYYKIS